MFKKIIQFIIKILSQFILRKYHPQVIGITGSVGKTSTKLAIETILRDSFDVRSTPKNYNTELGVPLTIIGENNPGHSVYGWCGVILKAIKLLLWQDKTYPKILILEMAADHPGDIQYLSKLARPFVGVITSVGPTHLEFFNQIDRVAKEKATLVLNLPHEGTAIINTDQQFLATLSKKVKSKLLTFGIKTADLQARNIHIDRRQGGLKFNLVYRHKEVRIEVPNLLGRPAVYSLLAASAVGVVFNLDLATLAERIKNYSPPAGRLNLLPGIKYTKIIDDSYNASPLAVKAALEVLSHLFCDGNKFAVLGDMLELGHYTQTAHQEVGQEVARYGIDYLITVGERSRDIALAAQEYGMNPDRIFSFDNSIEAGNFLQDRIQEGDLILIKGSAAIAMEKIVKKIMAEPERAGELLVRQEKL